MRNYKDPDFRPEDILQAAKRELREETGTRR